MWKVWVLAWGLAGAMPATALAGAATPLATAPVRMAGEAARQGFDGVVEAVRQTVVAAQVAGSVTALEVKAGDSVKAGQVLARIDARAAEHSASASDAQVRSAQALLDVARKDFERQTQLYKQQYISQAALERAESQFKAAQAQAAALLAQADAARTTSGLHVVRAPYAGVVAEVPVALGDMAMPGRALLTLYEPGALRVAASLPQSALTTPAQGVSVEFPGLPEARRWLDGGAGAGAADRGCGDAYRAGARAAASGPAGRGARQLRPRLGACGRSGRRGPAAGAALGRGAARGVERGLCGRCKGCGAAAPGAAGARRR